MDLGCRLLVLLKARVVGERDLMLYEELLTASGLKMQLLDERQQFFPGFPVGATIFPGIECGEFPPLAAREDTDGLLEGACECIQSACGCRLAALPKVGSELVV